MNEHYTGPHKQPFQFRASFGSNQPSHADEKLFLKFTGGYTVLDKQIATASTTAIHAAITGSSSAVTTTTTSITNPDVPRNIVVTSGGTAADIPASNVTVTGTNVEGKVITENFLTTLDTGSTMTGNKAFATVTSIAIPVQDGSGATYTIGTGTKLGVEHRFYPSKTTVYVVYDTGTTGPTVPATIDSAPTITAHETLIENNTVTPVTVPNSSRRYRIYYFSHHASIGDLYDNPIYSTSTSTSSSSSTSSTSTSSTSTSTSSTSTSTSSTSTSTSSTSTSTTTAP